MERRQFIRVKENLDLQYKIISPPDGEGDATSLNISEGGISFPVNQQLLPGLVLEISIKFPGSEEEVDITGEVVWVKKSDTHNFPFVVGLRFINISPEDRDRIYYYVHKKLEQTDKTDDIGWIE